jgi:hypothetical protein
MARLGVIIMSVTTMAAAVTSCGKGERALFCDTTAAPALAADDPVATQSEDKSEARSAVGRWSPSPRAIQ